MRTKERKVNGDFEAYRRLVAAVIIQGISDLRTSSGHEKLTAAAVRDRARAWVFDRHTEARDFGEDPNPNKCKIRAYKTEDPYGFEWCCSILDIDPEWLRQKALTREGIRSLMKFRGSNQYERK
jgi:hypothetical protein